ncbi:MAG: plasmid stabilization protein [Blastopirellula sp.]|nr:MAG: plasmid stabilization protein [Blastopirellula sp.]
MPLVDISSAAEADLYEIAFYIGHKDRSPQGAERLLQAIEESCALHAQQPLMGTARPDIGDGIRLFSCGTKSNPNGWIVIYRPIENGIELVRVFRGSQNYTKILSP